MQKLTKATQWVLLHLARYVSVFPPIKYVFLAKFGFRDAGRVIGLLSFLLLPLFLALT